MFVDTILLQTGWNFKFENCFHLFFPTNFTVRGKKKERKKEAKQVRQIDIEEIKYVSKFRAGNFFY